VAENSKGWMMKERGEARLNLILHRLIRLWLKEMLWMKIVT